MSYQKQQDMQRLALRHLRQAYPVRPRARYFVLEEPGRVPYLKRERHLGKFKTREEALRAARTAPDGTHYAIYELCGHLWRWSSSTHEPQKLPRETSYSVTLYTRCGPAYREKADTSALEEAERRARLAALKRRISARDWRGGYKPARKAAARARRHAAKAECHALLRGDEMRAERFASPTCGLRPHWW